MCGEVAVGKRALVSFGKNKYYAGIIHRIHNNPPQRPQIKDIENVLDEQPIVYPSQFEFWQWLADYYMCTIGEVVDNALPNFFKLSSERHFQLSENDWDKFYKQEIFAADETLEVVYNSIASYGKISLQEIKTSFSKTKGVYYLNALIDKGLIEPIDIVKDKYKPRYEKFVRLNKDYEDLDKLNTLFSQIQTKSPQQYKLLLRYFSLDKSKKGISKAELLAATDVGANILKALVDKAILSEYNVQVDRFKLQPIENPKPLLLSQKQANTLTEIQLKFETKNVVLLRGITGSGKTEIYIQLIQSYLSQGKTCLFILPEIALTQQIVGRLNHYFGDNFVVYHSLISHNKRYEIWKKVYRGEVKFIVGTRSSIFLPFPQLDLAIIDEEHDNSLKQTDVSPKFHLRDSLIRYASIFQSKILLGSATPSVESYYNAMQGKYAYVELLERYGTAILPEVQLISLRDEQVAQSMKSYYSEPLLQAVQKTVDKGEQVVLFQNRRGYSPYIQCNTCGFIQKCDQCDVRLTYHTTHKLLVCHYCSKKYTLSPKCPNCGSPELRTKGLGTQKVEEEIQLFLPNIKVGRLDLDTAGSISKIDHILESFKAKQFDVLIGTQMVSKGLDFENLTLVGVVQADIFFSFIDYKTDEKAFQTLSQVAGRVGRGDKKGLVLIQTTQPENKVIGFVLASDYKGFVEQELQHREKFIYPPYCKLIKIDIRHLNEDLVDIYAKKIVDKLAANVKSNVLGPVTPPVSRIRNRYIREIMIKLPRGKELPLLKQQIRGIINSELQTLNNRNFSIEILVDV